jgi:hypothetical protein
MLNTGETLPIVIELKIDHLAAKAEEIWDYPNYKQAALRWD